jgi:pimeloyl-ACP methyl ester carboxylesterase
MAQTIVAVEGVPLCVESFGRAGDPTIVLVMGQAGSMLWWDERFCRLLASGGRRVVRYDARDTGRSVAYPPGRPPYGPEDLAVDALRAGAAVGARRVHLVGVSMGGALAQVAALAAPERVASLSLLMTASVGPWRRDLPGMSERYAAFLATLAPDWTNPQSVAETIVADCRELAGERPFDEAATRRLVARDHARATSVASLQNHAAIASGPQAPLDPGRITAPTLVVGGTADPMFGVAHAAALAAEIRGARLVVLDGAGHLLLEPDWPLVAAAILLQTAGS